MNKLIESLEKLNVPFDEFTVEKFQKYMEGILEWNEKINLTAITDKEEFISKHYIDSILSYHFPE